MRKLVWLIPVLLISTGCSEIQLGSHFWKKATHEPAPYHAPAIKGPRKIGNPYTILGKKYYPLPSSQGYRAKGIASWYGKDFHGKKTANGERYNMYDMTAAHPTLPLPTYVRVTNLENGRSIVVRVNDRGPFLRGRVIDLSYRAAVELNMAEKGTSPVLLEALPTDGSRLTPTRYAKNLRQGVERVEYAENKDPHRLTRRPVEIQLPPAEKTISLPRLETPTLEAPEQMADGEDIKIGETEIFVQTGAFSNIDNADRQKAKVSAHYDGVNVIPATIAGRTLHRVRIGPLDNVKKADAVLSKLVRAGFDAAQIIVE